MLGALLEHENNYMVPAASVWMWILMGNLMSVTISGRTKFFGGLAVGFVLTWILFRAITGQIIDVNTSMMLNECYSVGVGLALVIFAIWAYVRALQAKFISLTETAIAICIATAVWFFFVWLSPQFTLRLAVLLACVSILGILPWQPSR